jgi:hypothetical protein
LMGLENGTTFYFNGQQSSGQYNNWQSGGPNGGGNNYDSLQMYANNGSNTGKWDDVGERRAYIGRITDGLVPSSLSGSQAPRAMGSKTGAPQDSRSQPINLFQATTTMSEITTGILTP